MARRNIVRIDEAKCTGCGLCATACAEGAIKIINGKARLISDSYCDGLGACLGHCPEGAITIEQREAAAFDEEAVKAQLGHGSGPHAEPLFVCPGLAAQQLTRDDRPAQDDAAEVPSHLGQWPVQLKLVSPTPICSWSPIASPLRWATSTGVSSRAAALPSGVRSWTTCGSTSTSWPRSFRRIMYAALR